MQAANAGIEAEIAELDEHVAPQHAEAEALELKTDDLVKTVAGVVCVGVG